MGHAGAFVTPGEPDARTKIRALEDAGVVMTNHPAKFGAGMSKLLGRISSSTGTVRIALSLLSVEVRGPNDGHRQIFTMSNGEVCTPPSDHQNLEPRNTRTICSVGRNDTFT